MATAYDLDELLTCGVCFWAFDAEMRKPKYLPCSHTLCLVCIKVRKISM